VEEDFPSNKIVLISSIQNGAVFPKISDGSDFPFGAEDF
jgi:hypothetical protein